MSPVRLVLEWVTGAFAVCRLGPAAEVPGWALRAAGSGGGLLSVTRTDRELSIVVSQDAVPEGVRAERGWVAVRIAGTLGFGEVGILARLTGALAGAGVPVFALSTFDTDIVMFKAGETARAVEALESVADVSGL